MPRRRLRFDAARLTATTLFASAWVAAAAPLSGQPAKDAPTIDVALSSFEFTPETMRLVHGRPYVLHLVNRSGGGHDFTARAFFDAAMVAPGDQAKIDHGSVELDGHEEARIHLTAPAVPGRYKVHCAHFLHSMFGMTGTILVE